MRHLLVEAQVKFRKMVDDNQRLADKIDVSITAANQEVDVLRAELADTNRRMVEIASPQRTPDVTADVTTDVTTDVTSDNNMTDTANGLLSERKVSLSSKEEALDPCSVTSHDLVTSHDPVTSQANRLLEQELTRIREENNQLRHLVDEMRDELESYRSTFTSMDTASPTLNGVLMPPEACSTPAKTPLPGGRAADQGRMAELRQSLMESQQDLSRSTETLYAMKADRKRLKGEKLELLNQLRQLYGALEDKDAEIRDFIRNFEQRMRESDHSIKQLAAEKAQAEEEKWEMLRRAQEAADRVMTLTVVVDQRNQTIHTLEAQLAEAQQSTRRCDSPYHLKSNSFASVDSVLKSSSLDGQSPSADEMTSPYGDAPTNDTPSLAPSTKSDSSTQPALSAHSQQILCSSLERMSPGGDSSRSSDNIHSDSGCQHMTLTSDIVHHVDLPALRRKRPKNPGALSRLFSKPRTRRSIAVSDPSITEASHCPEFRQRIPPRRTATVHFVDLEGSEMAVSPRLSVLSQDNYQEKLDTLAQTQSLAAPLWRAHHVLAWLEIDMNMPMYGKACGENIKSGKVLLGLSDAELGSALGLKSALHRRKLRLAIEQQRDRSNIKYPKQAFLDHTWIAHRWLGDLGLAQYSVPFETHLVDGRLLNVLTRKDLERHLSVTRKFHQASILHGVELLRMLSFDKEELLHRRSQCESTDADPLVWSNQRVVQWLESIDLHEYSANLRDSGVHGAVLLLEPSFTADALATALGIPQAKTYVRRHLASELDSLLRPARSVLDPSGRKSRGTFTRSYRGGTISEDESGRGSGRKLSFRGSLGRAFSRRSRQDLAKDQDGSQSSLNSSKRSHSVDLKGTVV